MIVQGATKNFVTLIGPWVVPLRRSFITCNSFLVPAESADSRVVPLPMGLGVTQTLASRSVSQPA